MRQKTPRPKPALVVPLLLEANAAALPLELVQQIFHLLLFGLAAEGLEVQLDWPFREFLVQVRDPLEIPFELLPICKQNSELVTDRVEEDESRKAEEVVFRSFSSSIGVARHNQDDELNEGDGCERERKVVRKDVGSRHEE